MPKNVHDLAMNKRFRGFLPVVVDVETAGIHPETNALLEIALVIISKDKEQGYVPSETYFEHVQPFEGAVLDPKSLEFTGIDPYQALRFAVDEKTALTQLFKPIHKAVKDQGCQRAVLVGHNAWFDLLFIKAACNRTGVRSPFHDFTCFDTASLAGFVYGQTVLAKAVQAAGIAFDLAEAHSAIYDAEKTAALFCAMLNA